MSAAESDFTAVMSEMRAHSTSSHEGTPREPYAPPPGLAHFFPPGGDASAAKLREAVAPLAEQAKRLAKDMAKAIQDKLFKDAQEMQAGDVTGNLYSYVIDAVRAQNRQEAHHALEAIYDAGQALGVSQPGAQKEIVSYLVAASSLFHELLERIDAYLATILKDITAWLPEAQESIRGAFSKLAPWIEESF